MSEKSQPAKRRLVWIGLGFTVLWAAGTLLSACRGLAPETPALTNGAPDSSPRSVAGIPTPGTDILAGDQANEDRLALRLAYASDRAGNGDIFVTTSGSESPINLTDNPDGDWDPAWSPVCADDWANCRIAFTSHRSGDSEIWTMDVNGRNLSNITRHPAWDYWPAWSPDGQSIVFVSERDGDQELFVQPVGGDQAVQLTFNQESDRLPTWAPDGRRIAFAAVRNGIEEIHIITVDGLDERAVTAWPLKASAPAWSPDGSQIAFIGWDEDNHPGIYLLDPATEQTERLWQSPDWIGSLSWADCPGQDWLLFAAWQAGNHDVYALPLSGADPLRLTFNAAWEDAPALFPYCPDATTKKWSALAEAQAQPGLPPAAGRLVRGANVADLGDVYLLREVNFEWAKGYVNWETVEPEAGQYRWADPDNTVTAFESRGLNVLLRVHGTPPWARPEGTFLSYPPQDVNDFGRFMEALAGRYRGRVAAYEIWNEPNLSYEWGYLAPDPDKYAALLRAAYLAVKKADPDALVISGGLATTGDGSDTAMGDLVFLERLYAAGAGGYFDALGSHPYAYGHAPDEEDPWGLSLSRVSQQRQVMLSYGDESTPIWITELGWVLATSWDLEEHESIGVSELEQARYLVRAYQKVATEWPYVDAVFVFNLDFASVPWYTASEPMRWYAILNPDGTPRPAYTQLRLSGDNKVD